METLKSSTGHLHHAAEGSLSSAKKMTSAQIVSACRQVLSKLQTKGRTACRKRRNDPKPPRTDSLCDGDARGRKNVNWGRGGGGGTYEPAAIRFQGLLRGEGGNSISR